MKFRKLYWVTEQLDEQGRSQIAGVFTSIPDLCERGLKWCEGLDKRHNFRLTLVKLDSADRPLGSWVAPEYGSIREDLQQYVDSEEFSPSQIEALVEALQCFKVRV